MGISMGLKGISSSVEKKSNFNLMMALDEKYGGN